MTLTEFLLARIAEDEECAKAASVFGPDGSRWVSSGGSVSLREPDVWPDDWPTDTMSAVAYDEGRPAPEQAWHIAHWDPERVLAECEAKRQIVAMVDAASYGSFSDGWYAAKELAIRHLALPYADHRDYQQEWAS